MAGLDRGRRRSSPPASTSRTGGRPSSRRPSPASRRSASRRGRRSAPARRPARRSPSRRPRSRPGRGRAARRGAVSTCAASSSARTDASVPFRFPIGLRTASMISASRIDRAVNLPPRRAASAPGCPSARARRGPRTRGPEPATRSFTVWRRAPRPRRPRPRPARRCGRRSRVTSGRRPARTRPVWRPARSSSPSSATASRIARRAADRPAPGRRSARSTPSPARVHLDAAEAIQLAARPRVVLAEQLAPAAVAELGRPSVEPTMSVKRTVASTRVRLGLRAERRRGTPRSRRRSRPVDEERAPVIRLRRARRIARRESARDPAPRARVRVALVRAVRGRASARGSAGSTSADVALGVQALLQRIARRPGWRRPCEWQFANQTRSASLRRSVGADVREPARRRDSLRPASPASARQRSLRAASCAVAKNWKSDERDGPLGVRGGEERRSWLPPSEKPNTAARSEPDGVEDGAHVVHPRLQVRQLVAGRGRTARCRACRRRSAANERRQALEELAQYGDSPAVARRSRRSPGRRTRSRSAAADDLVGDRDAAVPRVADVRLHGQHRLPTMAATATERKLLVAGEWVETGEWIDVRSPYSGEVVGRVAKAGADETRRAIDAAEEAMREPLPAHKRAEILVKVAGAIGRRHEELAQTICAEAGKPLKTARVEASRAMSTYTIAAVEARTLAGDVVPMDASQAGEGKLAFTLRVPIGRRRRDQPVQLPAQPRRPQDRARARRRLRRRAQAGDRDAALGAAPRRAGDRGRAPAGLAERRRRPVVRDRRRPGRRRARGRAHLHRQRRGRLEAEGARAAQARRARARQRDAR